MKGKRRKRYDRSCYREEDERKRNIDNRGNKTNNILEKEKTGGRLWD